MKVPAILYSEGKQIEGILMVQKAKVDFQVIGFDQTTLNCSIEYKDIKKVNYHRLFELEVNGLEILLKNRKRNVFLVINPQSIKAIIETHVVKI